MASRTTRRRCINSRCYRNPYCDYGGGNNNDDIQALPDYNSTEEGKSSSNSAAWDHDVINNILRQPDECIVRLAMPRSTGNWDKRNHTIYTGLGGVALAFLRYGQFLLNDDKNKNKNSNPHKGADYYFNRSRQLALHCKDRSYRCSEVSFYCGQVGHITVAAVASHLLGDYKTLEQLLDELLLWEHKAIHHQEDEILFGRAGYIYALLFVRKQLRTTTKVTSNKSIGAISSTLNKGCITKIDEALRRTASQIIQSGSYRAKKYKKQYGYYKQWPLMWHCFDEPYLGAAHGHIGILSMLYQCYHLLSPPEKQAIIVTTSQLLSTIRFHGGNVPTVLEECSSSSSSNSNDCLVHWCHGAPGIPGLAYSAAQAVKIMTNNTNNNETVETNDDFLIKIASDLKKAAIQAGEVVWSHGVVLKGTGLCHGIAGNGYTFLTLYRLLKLNKAANNNDEHHNNQVLLQRAMAFANLTHHGDYLDVAAKQPDNQRAVPGVPDSPMSLMEGHAGLLCFLLDLTSNSGPDCTAFPGWEI